VEVLESMDYLSAMSKRLENRVEELERKFSELAAQVLDLKRRKKDWRSTFEARPKFLIKAISLIH